MLEMAEENLNSERDAVSETILDHPLCASCALCCLPWNHHPSKDESLRKRATRETAGRIWEKIKLDQAEPELNAVFDASRCAYPCGWLTPAGCALSADERPESCREFACKRLRAAVRDQKFDLPRGRDEEWLLALFESYVGSRLAYIPDWLAPLVAASRLRRTKRIALLRNAETEGS